MIRVFIIRVLGYIIEEKGTEQDEGYDQGNGNGDEGAQGGDVYRVASVHICFFPSLSVFHLFPRSNEPSSHACMDIWRLPRGSNTPQLAALEF